EEEVKGGRRWGVEMAVETNLEWEGWHDALQRRSVRLTAGTTFNSGPSKGGRSDRALLRRWRRPAGTVSTSRSLAAPRQARRARAREGAAGAASPRTRRSAAPAPRSASAPSYARDTA